MKQREEQFEVNMKKVSYDLERAVIEQEDLNRNTDDEQSDTYLIKEDNKKTR